MIKERCGTVSYKSGDAFYRANKVIINQYSPNVCEATVTGKENFHVVVEKGSNDSFRSSCSCPTLASFTKDCQHIAAVLLAIYNLQSNNDSYSEHQEWTNGLFSLFKEPSTRLTQQQSHFENRQVLEVNFTLKPIKIKSQGNMFGIELTIGSTKIKCIRQFLTDIKEGVPSKLSSTFTFDVNLHCFRKETDAVLQHLIQVLDDEKVFIDTLPVEAPTQMSEQLLLIPPSPWQTLFPLLRQASLVKLIHEDCGFDGVQVTDGPLPLQFDLIETERASYQLKVMGLETTTMLEPYHLIIHEGRLTELDRHDCKRLGELKRMLDHTGTNYIPIAKDQINFFMNKVVPGLKNLGEVNITGLQHTFEKIPLVAKLYLDRVSNRLLAGIEFHYENTVINPLEDNKPSLNAMLVRDVDKEEEILRLMEESLFTKTDSAYFLHNEALEYDFLYYVVPKLQKLARIYTTTAIKNRIVKENTFPKIRVKLKKERINWLEFKFEMDGIPDDQVRELLEALEEKRKYYRLRNGALLSLETKEFEQINQFLHGLPDQDRSLDNGLRVPVEQSLQFLDTIENTETFLLEDSFRDFLESIKRPGSLTYKVPSEFAEILRDYQIQGYQWMKTLASYRFGGILADDMGLGKTLQSITYMVSVLTEIRIEKQPILIVCPSSVTYNWLNEINKFSPSIHAVVMDGNKVKREKLKKAAGEQDAIITSYPVLRRDIQWFEKQCFHTVFFDEAQAFKNPVTQTARAVKRIQAVHRFALTGTPVENSLEELWSIFHVVFPELFLGLKDYSHLSRKTISRRAKPFLLRRLKQDVLKELPVKRELHETVELHPEQKELYAAYLAKLRHDTLKHLDKNTLRKNKIRILAGLTRLRQICCHPALFVDEYKGSSAKFDQLMHLVEEAKHAGRRVLVFSQFTKMLDLIGRELTRRGLQFFYLDGQTPSEERVEVCDQFNKGQRNLFLISMKAGGTGLNLTGADTVIMYDSWWNPAVEEQAADRAYRMGQNKDVQVVKLVARGTIEEKMNELQEKKRHLIKELIDPEEKVSSTLTEDDIREILMINRE